MSATNPSSIWKRLRNGVWLLMFLALLWLPALDTVFKLDQSSIPGENRLMAEFPKWQPGLEGFKKYLAGLEAYFNDHFGFRNLLIWSHRAVKAHVFHDQKGHLSVVTGRDGWLYFNESRMVEHYRGVLRFTPKELSDWQRLLEHYHAWLAQRGIKFVFVIVPDKQSIYPEFLPAWMEKVGPDTKLDQFVTYMRTNSTVEVVDLRPTLLASRATAPMYLKTDSHWNQLGAFLACEKMFADLAARQLPGIRPLSLDDFDRTNRVAPPGDLTPLAGVDFAESNAIFLTPKPGVPRLEPQEQKVPPRNQPVIITQNPDATGSAVFYHDSFGEYWLPFLGLNFNRVYCFKNLFLQSPFFDKDFVEEQKPAVVIVEVVERSFNVARPEKLLAAESANALPSP